MEKIYYQDQYIKDFTAEIIEILEKDDKYHVVLDKTAFFPGGGGQFCDLGKIDVHDVCDVYEKDKKVYHVLNKKPIKIHKVKCFIDWERREDGMHQHFSQHILSGCFYSLFKKNTTAFHLGSESCTVDIQGPLSIDEIREAEKMANDIIGDNIEVETLTPSKKDLKKIWIRRDLPDTSEEIRIVKIGELDSNACCGVHPKSTLDVRMIKIRKWEKNKDSIRIEYLAGKRAINSLLKRDVYLTDICRYLSSTEEDAISGVEKLRNKLEEALCEKRKLEDTVANFEIKEMINDSAKINDISVVKKTYVDKDIKYISKMASKITESENTISLIGVKNEDRVNLVFASSKNINNVSMNKVLKDTMTLLDGKGGGSDFLAQGSGKNNGNLEVALDYAFGKIEKELV